METMEEDKAALLDFYAPEDLHPDLVPYVRDRGGDFGPILKHPLVISVGYIPLLNKMLNRQYLAKTEQIAKALAEGRWYSVVFLHERPFRVDAFSGIRHRMTDEDYWPLFGALWEDSENLHEWGAETIRSLWFPTPDRGHRELVMDEDERVAFAALPDTLRVFRGYDRRNARGWSWTTDQARAEWFARRWDTRDGSRARLATATIERGQVLAHFTGRGESEVVIDPSRLGRIRTVALAPRVREDRAAAFVQAHRAEADRVEG